MKKKLQMKNNDHVTLQLVNLMLSQFITEKLHFWMSVIKAILRLVDKMQNYQKTSPI